MPDELVPARGVIEAVKAVADLEAAVEIVQGLQSHLGQLQSSLNSSIQSCGLNTEDLLVIEGMISLVQDMGSRSVRRLLQFLESSSNGDFGCVMIKKDNKGVEVGARVRVPDSVSEEFGI